MTFDILIGRPTVCKPIPVKIKSDSDSTGDFHHLLKKYLLLIETFTDPAPMLSSDYKDENQAHQNMHALGSQVTPKICFNYAYDYDSSEEIDYGMDCDWNCRFDSRKICM